jgi:DNA repair protein RadA/Sms
MAKRLGARDERIFLAVTKSVEEILEAVRKIKPRVVAIDSINVMYTVDASEGEMAQIKVAAQKLVDAAKHKQRGFTLVLVGHITKDDSIAGPKQLEHLVDIVVTYVETENGRRFLRSGKNRHGPSGEVAVFEMTTKGLVEIPVASALIVTAKDTPERGYVVFPCVENARPLLIEVESRVSMALTEGSLAGVGDRKYTGMDGLKMPAIIAVLREDAGLDLRGRDIFVEVTSILGQNVADPAIDLAAATSIISSADRYPMPAGLVTFGIVSISGKVKPVQRAEARMEAAKSAGFKIAILPKQQVHLAPKGIRAIGVSHVKELREVIASFASKVTSIHTA